MSKLRVPDGDRRIKTKKPTKKKKIKKTTKKRPFWGIFTRLLFMGFIWGCIAVSAAVLWYSADLPNIEDLQGGTRKPSVTIQTESGDIIASYGDLHEDVVKVENLPVHVPQALMAVEDRRFYSHFGVDPIGLVRAFYRNYTAGRVVQGGSTLTQQLAKNFLFSHGKFSYKDRSMTRKIQEVLLALWLEWKFTKDQILTMYLNRVYFGSGTYGIDAAAQRYFGKSARDLSVFEAALMAGLLKAPSKYSPAHNPELSKSRATVVLELMVETGFIKSYKEHLENGAQNLDHLKETSGKGYRYFTDWVYESIPNFIGNQTEDIVVVTTINPDLQKHAEDVATQYLNTMGKDYKASQAAILAMRPDGAIQCMVGGKSYAVSQFNRTLALRQSGSAFKPIVYLAALEHGWTPDTMIDDTPPVIGDWKPRNYKYIEQGEIPLRVGLMKSVNAISVRIGMATGPEAIIELANRLGINSYMYPSPSIVLGTMEVTLLDLAVVYATIANHGRAVSPYGIKEIRNKSGDILYRHQNHVNAQLIAENHLTDLKSMLRGVIQSGTGRAANVDNTVIGKTGSNGDRDAYFVGYRGGQDDPDGTYKGGFRDIVVGTWVGNDDCSRMIKISTGGRMPARMAASVMRGVVSPVDTKQKGKPQKPPARAKSSSKRVNPIHQNIVNQSTPQNGGQNTPQNPGQKLSQKSTQRSAQNSVRDLNKKGATHASPPSSPPLDLTKNLEDVIASDAQTFLDDLLD